MEKGYITGRRKFVLWLECLNDDNKYVKYIFR